MDESSETSSAKDVPAGSLRTALNDLKRLIQSIVDGVEPTVRALRGAWSACVGNEVQTGPPLSLVARILSHSFGVLGTRNQEVSLHGPLPASTMRGVFNPHKAANL
jgi:hypothetical protein